MLKKIKIRLAALGLLPDTEDTLKDGLLTLMLEDAIAAVLAYCHIKTFPESLEYLVRDLVVRTVQADNEDNVAAIKRGDTQINYVTTINKDSFSSRDIAAMNGHRIIRIG